MNDEHPLFRGSFSDEERNRIRGQAWVRNKVERTYEPHPILDRNTGQEKVTIEVGQIGRVQAFVVDPNSGAHAAAIGWGSVVGLYDRHDFDEQVEMLPRERDHSGQFRQAKRQAVRAKEQAKDQDRGR